MKALLVIDIQKEYVKKYKDSLVSDINVRIQQAIQNQELVVYVKNVRNLKSGKESYEFAEGLNVCSSYCIYKEKASVFSDHTLIEILQQNNISAIEIIGIDGNCCVARSAIDAKKLGYQVIVPCNYVGVQNIQRFEKNKKDWIKQGIILLPESN